MDMAAASRDDWKFWPNREDVVLRVLAAEGEYDSHLLEADGGSCKRRAPTWKEITASAGATTSKNLVWLVPAAHLPENVEVRAGYQIRDSADVDHTVLEAQSGKFANTWRCVTIALAVVYELHATGVLTRPDNTQDDAGRMALSSYSTVATVKCRVQPQDSEAGEHFDRLTTARKFTAYCDTQLAPKAKDVFTVTSYVSPGGAIAGVQSYTVKGYRSPERLDQLCSLDLEIIS
jgi:hypothetical protein